MNLVMPLDTVYITILRNPVEMFESMYSYYNLEKYYRFKFDWFNLKNHTRLPSFSSRYANKFGLNQMFFDLGFDLSHSKTHNYQSYIDYLNSIFDLVLIEDFMDESLILLKNLLCWSIDDVITFKVNARIKKKEIGDLAVERIRKLNHADVMLYNFFLKKFKQKISELQTETLTKDIQELRTKRKFWFDQCVNKIETKKLQFTNSSSSNIVKFVSKNDDLICQQLTMRELKFTEQVRTNQLKLWPASISESTFEKAKSVIISKLHFKSKKRKNQTRTNLKSNKKKAIKN